MSDLLPEIPDPYKWIEEKSPIREASQILEKTRIGHRKRRAEGTAFKTRPLTQCPHCEEYKYEIRKGYIETITGEEQYKDFIKGRCKNCEFTEDFEEFKQARKRLRSRD